MSTTMSTRPGAGPLGDAPRLDPRRAASLEARLFGTGQGPRIRHYVLRERIGAGSHGLVHRAFDTKLKRSVALKEVLVDSPRTLRRLEREAQGLARLSHPNVVQVHESGLVGDARYFIAMEFVDGANLETWLQEEPRPQTEVLALFAQVADGLAALHREGLVHRDVKPANIIVGADRVPKLVDFGLVRVSRAPVDFGDQAETIAPHESQSAVGADADARCVTVQSNSDLPTVSASPSSGLCPGASASCTWAEIDPEPDVLRTFGFVGTPKFAAPEQFMGLPSEPPSDQFSFFVALFEATVGTHPFSGKTYAQLARQVTSGEVEWPRRGLSRPLRRLLERGLCVRSEARFVSMEAVAEAIRGLGQRSWTRRALPWLFSVGVAAGAVAAAGGPPALDCETVANDFHETWAQERAAIQTRAEAEAGARTASVVLGELDHWVEGWGHAREAACEAEAVGAASAPETIACLNRGRDAFDLLVSTLQRELDVAVEPSASPILRFGVWLAEPGRCAVDSQTWAALSGDVQGVSERMARVRVLRLLGRWKEAETLARLVSEQAALLGADELSAVADGQRGALLLLLDRPEEAVPLLEAALLRADSNGQTLLGAEVRGQLGLHASANGERTGALLVKAALAQLDASGSGQGEVAAWLLAGLAQAQLQLGQWAASVETGADALAAFDRLYGGRDARVAASRINLAVAYWRNGDIPAATENAEQGWELLSDTFGPDHPLCAKHAISVARIYMHAQRWSEARDVLESSLGSAAPLPSLHGRGGANAVELAFTLSAMQDASSAVPLVESTRPEPGDDSALASRWADVAMTVYQARQLWGAAGDAAQLGLRIQLVASPPDDRKLAVSASRVVLLRHYDERDCEAREIFERHRVSIERHIPATAERLAAALSQNNPNCKEQRWATE